MEISAGTFTAMRDVGCMSTQHVAGAGRSRGMLLLTSAGIHHLLAGASVVKLLHHYCCSRFDTPTALVPEEGESSLAAKRHNWAIVSKILKEALRYELAWERRELIVQGDIVEVIVLLKQILDLVATHRLAEKGELLRHKILSEPAAKVDIATRLSQPFVIGEKRSPAPHARPWLHNAKTPPPRLPPLPLQAPRRVKPSLPAEARGRGPSVDLHHHTIATTPSPAAAASDPLIRREDEARPRPVDRSGAASRVADLSPPPHHTVGGRAIPVLTEDDL